MNEWLSDNESTDIWKIKDLRKGKSKIYYKLQKLGENGYDIFETKQSLFNHLKKDLGLFFKYLDQSTNEICYIYFKKGQKHYKETNFADLINIAQNFRLEEPNKSNFDTSFRPSWKKSIVTFVLGGLLLSVGKTLQSTFSQNPLSSTDLIKETLLPIALKTSFVALPAVGISAMSKNRRIEPFAISKILLAGSMLPNPIMGQPLCSPQQLGSYVTTPESAISVTVSNNHTFLAVNSGLKILDTINIANPTLKGFCATPGFAGGVAILNNYAYVTDSTGLQIIDISNLSTPTIVGFFSIPTTPRGLKVVNNYAFIADRAGGVLIIDVSSPTSPSLVISIDNLPGEAWGIDVSGNYIYVADYDSGLQIVDSGNITNPIITGFCNTPHYARGVIVLGNYAYVADDASGIQVIDIRNKTNPIIVGFCDTPGIADSIAISGYYAFVADYTTGLQIIDIRNITNPIIVGSYSTSHFAFNVAASGNNAFIAYGTFTSTAGSLQIINPCFRTLTRSSSSSKSSTTPSSSSATSTPPLTSSSFPIATSIFSSITGQKTINTSDNKKSKTTIIGIIILGSVGTLFGSLALAYFLKQRNNRNKKLVSMESLSVDEAIPSSTLEPADKEQYDTYPEFPTNPGDSPPNESGRFGSHTYYQAFVDTSVARASQHYQMTPVAQEITDNMALSGKGQHYQLTPAATNEVKDSVLPKPNSSNQHYQLTPQGRGNQRASQHYQLTPKDA